ncbi:hypothetical protein OIU84_004128 [Salix udensis]|uniref:K-box domain-containing protein n=1 Tax=Salix udensis TaxID=889485 RepID=A0AAD6P3L3_9ROSI|nr:hypothetical protein OIU84_004128 [Salix udensis]
MFKYLLTARLFSNRSAMDPPLSINRTIERYQKRAKDVGISSKMVQDNIQPVKEDPFTLAKKIEDLEVSKRKLLGVGLEPCSIDELKQLENQLERSLTRLRSRKNQLLREQIQKLKGEEKILLEENTRLREKVLVLYMLYELSDPTLSSVAVILRNASL